MARAVVCRGAVVSDNAQRARAASIRPVTVLNVDDACSGGVKEDIYRTVKPI